MEYKKCLTRKPYDREGFYHPDSESGRNAAGSASAESKKGDEGSGYIFLEAGSGKKVGQRALAFQFYRSLRCDREKRALPSVKKDGE